MMYKAVIQAVLLYGREIFLVVYMIMTVLKGSYHIIPRRISGMTARRGAGREWEWALVEAALEAEAIWLMRE